MGGTNKTLHRTTDHGTIRAWAQAHKGEPARVRTTSDALKLRFGDDEPSYEPISWETWLEVFDAQSFAFLYEEPGYTWKVVRRGEHDDAAPA